MAKDKKSFILYCDLIHEVDHLTNEEKGLLFQHLLEYVNDKNPVLEDRVLLGSWKHIERQLKRDLAKYETIKEKRSEAGKKSAEMRQQKATNPTSVESVKHRSTNPTSVESVKHRSTNPTVNDTVNDTVNGTVTVNDIKEEYTFDEFWNAYDNKQGKSSVEYKWQRVQDEEKALIQIHVLKYVAATPDKQYRKLPMTYLSQKTWLDEELPSHSKPKAQTHNQGLDIDNTKDSDYPSII